MCNSPRYRRPGSYVAAGNYCCISSHTGSTRWSSETSDASKRGLLITVEADFLPCRGFWGVAGEMAFVPHLPCFNATKVETGYCACFVFFLFSPPPFFNSCLSTYETQTLAHDQHRWRQMAQSSSVQHLYNLGELRDQWTVTVTVTYPLVFSLPSVEICTSLMWRRYPQILFPTLVASWPLSQPTPNSSILLSGSWRVQQHKKCLNYRMPQPASSNAHNTQGKQKENPATKQLTQWQTCFKLTTLVARSHPLASLIGLARMTVVQGMAHTACFCVVCKAMHEVLGGLLHGMGVQKVNETQSRRQTLILNTKHAQPFLHKNPPPSPYKAPKCTTGEQRVKALLQQHESLSDHLIPQSRRCRNGMKCTFLKTKVYNLIQFSPNYYSTALQTKQIFQPDCL